MALAAGDRVGPYTIIALLGQGGMGEVYRAREASLGRDAAIKILPARFASDPDRVARFEREARTLAALNHPHIAQVYGFEHESGPSTSPGAGTLALAMEFVDGEDLAERLRRGALPLDEALPIAKQIAEGLAYAHERGIVHRDLKPANIKVTPDGVVKILDFGLAKAFDPTTESGAPESLSLSPTITSPAMTGHGVILGTAAYMSPEQARGRPVDRRTDIWAFGCVLYELLSGTRLFAGEDVTETIVQVMSREPAWDALPRTTPAAIRTLLRRCLQRDRARRLGDIHDAQLEIEDAMAGAPAGDSTDTAPRRRFSRWPVAASAVLGMLVGVLAWPALQVSRTPATPVVPRLTLSTVHSEGSEVGWPAMSPDATMLAYRARNTDGMPMIWVRRLADGELRMLAGTEDGNYPFWSPDSLRLGFFAGTMVKIVNAAGGPVQVAAGVTNGRGGTWNGDDTILFSPSNVEPLHRLSLASGKAEPVTTLPPDWQHMWPSFLPDGRRFLFTIKDATSTAESSQQGVYVGSLDTRETTRILPDLTSAVYSSGYLIFARGGRVTAAPFDLETATVAGPPAALDLRVATEGLSYLSGISAARDGTLAVRQPPAILSDPPAKSMEIRIVNRMGQVLARSAAGLFTNRMAMTPDGRSVAAQMVDPQSSTNDLYRFDVGTGLLSPLTTTRMWTGRPVWARDGRRLAYANQPRGTLDDLHVLNTADGTDTALVRSVELGEQPAAWSPDGRHLLVYRFGKGSTGLYAWSFDAKSLTPFTRDRVALPAAFSPTGLLVAFTSMESGRPEAVMATFPDAARRWPITTSGGRAISWRDDGKEILVATLAGHIAAFPVTMVDGAPVVGPPATLLRDVGMVAAYSAASADHSRIAVQVDPDAHRDKGEIQLVFGWLRTLASDR